VYLPAVSLLASANFDVRELEKVWMKNSEELQSSRTGARAKNRRSRKVSYLLGLYAL
jgi:hypothetical protein